MRIAVLCAGSYIGGTEIIALSVARGLRARGHDVRVLANAWTDGAFPARLAEAAIPHTLVHVGKISLSLRRPYVQWTAAALTRLPSAYLAARRWITDFAPDVVIANNRDTVLLLARLLHGRPVLFHMHEAPPVTRTNRMLYRRIASCSASFVAVSGYVRTRLTELGVDASRVRLVYNGVDAKYTESGRLPTPAEHRCAPTERGPFTIGIVGRIGDWKGHDDLIAALALLYQRGITFRCIVAGTGDADYVRALRNRAAALGIGDRLVWRGFVGDVAAVLSELDTCVVPSRVEESFGMVAVEAGLSGVPVVATRRGGLPEIVQDGDTGFLVEAENPGELAERLERLASNGSLRKRLGNAARERMLAHFTADRMVAQVEAACRDAVLGRLAAADPLVAASVGTAAYDSRPSGARAGD